LSTPQFMRTLHDIGPLSIEKSYMKSLGDCFNPGKIYFDGRCFEPDESRAGVAELANYLCRTLTSSSPFIHLYAENSIKTLLALFAIVKIGRIAVILDPRNGTLERSETQADTPPAAIITPAVKAHGWDFAQEVCFQEKGAPVSTESLHDVCIMLYTAADDGYAKAVMLTHENVLANAGAIASGNGVVPGTVSAALLPLSHGFGLQTGMIAPAISGADSVIAGTDILQKPGMLANLLAEHKVTHCYSIPAIYYLCAKALRHRAHEVHLSSAISGGYALTMHVYEAMLKSCGVPVRQGYGLSEASPVCSWVFPESGGDPLSIGQPIACCEMDIRSDNGQLHHPGSGEIVVRGKNVMRGYFNAHEQSEKVLKNGWLYTGDIGYKDGNGCYHLQSTKKRMINHAGMKVYPAELERYLLTNTNVERVCVFGKTDSITAERVGCMVALHHDTPENRIALHEWLKEAVADYKIPHQMEFVKVQAFDNLSTGKDGGGGAKKGGYIDR